MEYNNTIKTYYTKIIELYNSCITILTALNQSLSTTSPEVIVSLNDSDNNPIEYKIPSYVFLENKLNEISNNISNFFDMPKSGEMWFDNNSNMYKFHLLKSNSAPQVPRIDDNNIVTSFTENNYLKDFVFPKMYLKMNVENLTNNIEKIFVRKYIFHNETIYNIIKNGGYKTNEEYVAILYTFKKGIDYDVYDSIIDMPLKKETYNSRFEIESIVNLDGGNPWYDISHNNEKTLHYKLKLRSGLHIENNINDELEYVNQDDSSIRFSLKIGDYLALNESSSIYYVKEVNYKTNEVIIEEKVGHTAIQTFEENSDMFFTIYNNDFNDYNYVQIPLEENQYISLFIGTIYQNIRSVLSDGVLLDLKNINMIDENGDLILDKSGKPVNYIDYYNTYCENIGDILTGIGNISNPMLVEYTYDSLNGLQTSESIKQLVNDSINQDILKVVPINKHLIDDATSQEIINLHNQKSELNNKLTSINTNIDELYNTLTNTDWTKEVSNSQLSIRQKLDEHYTERTQITTQINNVIDSINAKSVMKYDEDLKYRIRGVLDTKVLEQYIGTLENNKIAIVGIDVQYKYKSPYSTTTSLSSINTNTFTDWNQYKVNDKERVIKIINGIEGYEVVWEEQNSTDNIIKWNQIDIPINQNEEVVVKVRYKYNIGQPFINLYTPWSDETTFVFPDEYKDMIQVSEIIDKNNDDSINAAFQKTLINDGYSEHVNNKFVSSNQVFYHMPENIYSGFNTSENNLISLKDKLILITQDIEKYSTLINESLNKKYSVYLELDNQTIELFAGSINRITINDTSIGDSFIKKKMNIIIKNTGENVVKLFSQFPGNSSITLLEDNREAYTKYVDDYERVPILVGNKMDAQVLGQWIYFRQNNPYTKEDIYLNDENQKIQDVSNVITGLTWEYNYNNYMRQDNSQILWPYKSHGSSNVNVNKNIWQGLYYDEDTFDKEGFESYLISTKVNQLANIEYENKTFENFYHYTNVEDGSNIYLMRYEDVKYVDTIRQKTVYLTENDNITEFSQNGESFLNNSMIDYNGAFLYPDIVHKNNIIITNTDIDPNNYATIEVGKEFTIPITLEYCLGNTTNNINNPITSIKKSLYFDLKDSIYNDPVNYLIEISVNNNYLSLNNYVDGLSILQPTGE